MTDPSNVNVEFLRRQNEQLQAQVGVLLKSGDGGGTSGGMEARVSRIEDRLDKATDAIGGVKVELATLSERVNHLPSKGYIDTRLIMLLALISALVLFADRIKAFAHI